MFELVQLEYLVAVAEYETVSNAARQMHISQPALSRSIQHLEEELGVILFDRFKNRVVLNENGKLAVEYARKILNDASFMSEQLKAFDQKRQTISLGAISPTPLWRLTPTISEIFPDLTLRSEVKTTDELLKGLQDDTYQIIITNTAVQDSELRFYPYLKEDLYIAVPLSHELAGRKEISLSELNGQSILRLSRSGFWDRLYKEKMPDSLFPILETVPAFYEVVKSSSLPHFATNLIGLDLENQEERRYIPVTDPEVHVTFYCLIKNKDAKRFSRLTSLLKNFQNIPVDRQL